MKKNKYKRKSREEKRVSAFEERKKFCPFSQANSPVIDYKDIKLLTRYISEKGKMIPSRITNVARKNKKSYPPLLKGRDFYLCYLIQKKITRL